MADHDRHREVRREELAAGDHAAGATADEPVSYGRRQHVSRLFVHRRAGLPD